MAQPAAPKRLQPRMTRGAFRVQFVLWSILLTLQLVVLIMNLSLLPAWDLGDYISLAIVTLTVIYLAFLLYVRHHDGLFWDEEEAARADWDRRGRAL
ncbi:hypothetical protein AB0O54_20330 [Pseudarthrobacter oxydans]|uniref:hypothetical protein n=1 Tax=Pseudarthrobacter oxydans TaxID=1671 RepID=UPI00103EBED7